MFFIISLNPNKHNAKIVGHAATLEQAILMVAKSAGEYVKSKNEPVMHRGAEDVKFTERVIFFTRKRAEQEYEIDVFRQQTHQIKTWTGSSYKDEETLARRFFYTEYSVIPEAPAPPMMPTTVTTYPSDDFLESEQQKANRAVKAKNMGLKCSNTVGGFPQSVLTSLQDNERFQQSRIAAEANRLPPPFKHTVCVCNDDDADDDDISIDEIIKEAQQQQQIQKK
jgi:hypothetical protein